jgi:hypothetical protein
VWSYQPRSPTFPSEVREGTLPPKALSAGLATLKVLHMDKRTQCIAVLAAVLGACTSRELPRIAEGSVSVVNPDGGDAMPAVGIDGTAPIADSHASGVNLPDLLWAYLGTTPNGIDAARASMDAVRKRGVTHARFVASAYWPNQMTKGKGWSADEAAYFRAFDMMLTDAGARGLRVIPSLLWNLYLFPDIAREPTSMLFRPGSASRNLAERYVSAVVKRYSNESAILFWELGNELNLLADLDVSKCTVCPGDVANACGGLAPAAGTPCKRSAADNFFSCNSCRKVSSLDQDLGQFAGAIAALIHSLDPAHPISSGHGYPRPSALHLAASPCPNCDFTPDSRAEYQSALANLHPAGLDIVSVHHYPGADAARFGDSDSAGIELLNQTVVSTAALGKQLYVGEYGELRGGSVTCEGATETCGGEPGRTATRRLLDAFVARKVPWTALWAYKFEPFCAGVPSCFTVDDTDPFMNALVAHERAYNACVGAPTGAPCPIGVCTGGACTPVTKADWTFAADASLTSWQHWTNCTGCKPETFALAAISTGTVATLSSFDLPCTGACVFPGSYVRSPLLPSTQGHAIATFKLRASAPGSKVRLFAAQSNGSEVAQSIASVPMSKDFATVSVGLDVPPTAATVGVRLDLLTPNATMEIARVTVIWEP